MIVNEGVTLLVLLPQLTVNGEGDEVRSPGELVDVRVSTRFELRIGLRLLAVLAIAVAKIEAERSSFDRGHNFNLDRVPLGH